MASRSRVEDMRRLWDSAAAWVTGGRVLSVGGVHAICDGWRGSDVVVLFRSACGLVTGSS